VRAAVRHVLLVGMTDTASGVPQQLLGTSDGAVRHPLDPEPGRSTKAAAVLTLGIAAVITGPLLAGLIPATLALVLARETRADLVAAQGYLTGSRQLRAGVALAWTGVALAAVALTIATVLGVIALVNGATHDFPATIN
jgi:hydroxylaminobenzene mutase